MRVLDRRTQEARTYCDIIAGLTRHVGGHPTATQRAMIERAAMLTVHLARMDCRSFEVGAMTEHDSRCYLAWTNTLTRTMRQLGLNGTPLPVETIDDIIRRGRDGSAT